MSDTAGSGGSLHATTIAASSSPNIAVSRHASHPQSLFSIIAPTPFERFVTTLAVNDATSGVVDAHQRDELQVESPPLGN